LNHRASLTRILCLEFAYSRHIELDFFIEIDNLTVCLILGIYKLKMNGQQLKERLERDIGFEANRARMLAEDAASVEISTYLLGKKLQGIDTKSISNLAKASLIAGLAGRQKVSEILQNLLMPPLDLSDVQEITTEISALVVDHQSILNSSRHRASCVNAHLNSLDYDTSLVQVYSPFLTEADMKKAQKTSTELVLRTISSIRDLNKWVFDVHQLLSHISDDSDSENSEKTRKGLISRKAISTYRNQWELFVNEKIYPSFGQPISESEANPLSEKLDYLENGVARSWTTIINDISEIKTSSNFQKRMSSTVGTKSIIYSDLGSYDFEISERPLKIQLSNNGVTKSHVNQFVKAMKAQFLAYEGKGNFNVSSQINGSVITVSMLNAKKTDLGQIENFVLTLL
jgi:hypothetical protein